MYKAFKEQITGNHRHLHYNTDAADATAKYVTDTSLPTQIAKNLRSYFDAVLEQMLTPVTYVTVPRICSLHSIGRIHTRPLAFEGTHVSLVQLLGTHWEETYVTIVQICRPHHRCCHHYQ